MPDEGKAFLLLWGQSGQTLKQMTTFYLGSIVKKYLSYALTPPLGPRLRVVILPIMYGATLPNILMTDMHTAVSIPIPVP